MEFETDRIEYLKKCIIKKITSGDLSENIIVDCNSKYDNKKNKDQSPPESVAGGE